MVNYMKKISKNKIDKIILFTTLLFAIISIITIYSAQTILKEEYQNLAIKQTIWYTIGFIVAFIIFKIRNKNILKYVWPLYIIGIIFTTRK